MPINKVELIRNAKDCINRFHWFQSFPEDEEGMSRFEIFQPPGESDFRPGAIYRENSQYSYDEKKYPDDGYEPDEYKVKRDFIAAFQHIRPHYGTPHYNAQVRIGRGKAILSCDQFVHIMLWMLDDEQNSLSAFQMSQLAEAPANHMQTIIKSLFDHNVCHSITDNQTQIEEGNIIITFNQQNQWSHIGFSCDDNQIISLNPSPSAKQGVVKILPIDDFAQNSTIPPVWVDTNMYIYYLKRYLAWDLKNYLDPTRPPKPPRQRPPGSGASVTGDQTRYGSQAPLRRRPRRPR